MRSPFHWFSARAGKLGAFTRDTHGATAVLFAILAIPISILALGTVDFARISVARQQMQEALDDASLIVARSTAKTDADIDKVGDAAFKELMARYKIGQLTSTFKSAPENSVVASAEGQIDPIILGLFTGDKLNAKVQSVIKRAQGTPVELVLVLDTTGSMGGQPLTDLKSAATTLVNDLHKNASGANLKIGVVPFGQYVNVGISRRNEPYMKTQADYVIPAPNPPQCTITTTKTTTKCDKVPGTCTTDGRSRPCLVDSNCKKTTVESAPVENCKGPNPVNFYGCAGSPAHPNNVTDDNLLRQYPGLMEVKCNAQMTLLTADKLTVTKAIAALPATGNTYIPSGLAWGFNMLSPQQPLTDAVAYDPTGDNRQPRKVMLLMTDGANTVVMQPATNLQSLGYGYRHDKSVTPATQANTYTTELCNNIKAKKIEIFTVAFMIDDPNAKKLVEGCATDKDHYFDATDAAKLQAAFGAIAESLRNLYIAK